MTLSYETMLILLAPLTASLFTAFFSTFLGERVYKIGVLLHAVAFLLSLHILFRNASTVSLHLIYLSPFLSHWADLFHFGLYIDRLATIMMTLISGISALIYHYSIRFMQADQGRARYHTLLSLTTFVLLCMVSSANLLMLFILWQLLSWLLPLLAHNYSHLPTVKGSFRTFLTHRIGDIAFLSGILLVYVQFGTLDFQELFIRAREVQAGLFIWPGGGLKGPDVTAITLLIFIGAMSKSAQFPLHSWLPDYLWAPTPVTAMLHAGIINAGGFLLNRLAPLYGLSSFTLHMILGIGALTALLGACMMLIQNDIKKTLGYSTIAQMGYMIMECGLGAFALAVFHLIAHGLFKATVFLNCGNMIHAARKEPRLPLQGKSDELKQFSYVTWVTGFISTLILPLIILLAAHGILNLSFRYPQGIIIFLFFSWVTSSQVSLTLYRLDTVTSWKVAALMLLALLLVVLTYLFAADSFTHFLYPIPGEIALYFQTARLNLELFDLLVGSMSLFIIFGWTFLYAKSHGKSIRLPEWVKHFQVWLYLLFLNRLYLDAISDRIGWTFHRISGRLFQKRVSVYIPGLIAFGLAFPEMTGVLDLPLRTIFLFFVLALMLPLFPLHGVFVAALTRLPVFSAIWAAFLMPAVGLYGVMVLLPIIPEEFLKGIKMFALAGIIYGSIKALSELRFTHLLAYFNLAFYSILWWYLAFTGKFTNRAAIYGSALFLVTAGLLLAWERVRRRYGDLDLGRIGGLAHSMPKFAILFSFLVMAAVGLPPFGLFSGFIGLLLHQSFPHPVEFTIILLAWLAASWYLYRMMQRLLFGPSLTAVPYLDFHFLEVATLVIILGFLLALGLLPMAFLNSGAMTVIYPSVMELVVWKK